ncbi:hypothetical protein MCBG_04625 [Micromonospora sp. M42]|uniref:hypothetical protein n=1 Tax=Micromonospora sp. M42 TaxID=457406 RepID=UPI0003EEAF9B|nr:hypothetical protein [Micromonospora sp. M42]EWM67492.1 hypothetical protein MCBG_04625 [Micromonospora sp. M42]
MGADAEPIPQATNPDRDDTSTDSNVVAPTGRTGRNFFFDDPSPAPSTRPRFAMFEDVTGQPGEVRPAWPITPAGRPHRATAEPDAPDRDAADAVAPGEPAPRPRHRGLPEPGASTGWDALATNARPAGPLARPEAGIPLARPEAATAVPGEAGAALPEATETEADSRRGRHAGPDDADAPREAEGPAGCFRATGEGRPGAGGAYGRARRRGRRRVRGLGRRSRLGRQRRRRPLAAYRTAPPRLNEHRGGPERQARPGPAHASGR